MRRFFKHPSGPRDAIAFDLGTRKQLTSKSSNDIVKLAIQGVVDPEDLEMLSSKSWRQVAVTWGALAGLTSAPTCRFG